MLLLDGKTVRNSRAGQLRRMVRSLGFVPKLAIVQIGTSGRSHAYVRAKQKFAEEIGVEADFRDDNV